MTDPTPGDVAIRPATVDDVAGMVRLHARAWQATYAGLLPQELVDAVVAARVSREDRWRARLAGPTGAGSALVAERDGRIAGFVFWASSGDEDATPLTAEVQAIYLDPDAIGQGIGRTLFAAAVSEAEAAGFSQATLWVLEDNRRARRFYEAAGWRPDGATKTDVRPAGTLHEVRYRATLSGAAQR